MTQSRHSVQLTLRRTGGRGGKRSGAGRKRVLTRPNVAHRPRPAHATRHPAHVTLRARGGLPSFRAQRVLAKLHEILDKLAKKLASFRVGQFSIQRDHIHLVVEADNRDDLRSGVARLAIRFALAMNKLLKRKTGKVWDDRYHRRDLTTPKEVRHVLAYVLANHRKHEGPMVSVVDPYATASTFEGWRLPDGTPGRVVAATAAAEPWRPRRATTWLLSIGWRLHGLVDIVPPSPSLSLSSHAPTRRGGRAGGGGVFARR